MDQPESAGWGKSLSRAVDIDRRMHAARLEGRGAVRAERGVHAASGCVVDGGWRFRGGRLGARANHGTLGRLLGWRSSTGRDWMTRKRRERRGPGA